MPQFGNVDFNDYETLIIRGKKANEKKQMQRDGKTETKTKNTHSETGHKMRMLEEATDVGKIKTVNQKVSKAIIAGRTTKNMNRKQLAAKIQETVKVVEEYETGKAKPNIKIINKFQRALGIKLTGAEFK